mmetsp:Transcript_23120/g.27833  ORF Transcript_23120/g.27833 Transcript_23120/m.27833 type:complete len:243 (-) Transcript_23120:554-1282(-)|eukprot:CAMPEP_0195257618 /NCGR_PEP_ID=MMETSP0706-20130129/6920_1 /TAXON_ID=33640 /ORGANISM="Asterionellopsis glacialis, Strain CCMP134" /LENGTH=242 /DNA_ID=CAMNT_0040310849 /DNA_START=310 /DNA_END=1038 /DNA_ORIENTATION=-
MTTIENISEQIQPLLHRRHDQKFAVLLHNVFSPEECSALIARSESVGYEQALLNVGGGKQELNTSVRNSSRCVIFDPDVAEDLYQRILSAFKDNDADVEMEKFLNAPWAKVFKDKTLDAVGCNERLSLLRYDPGDYFAPHYDGHFYRQEGARKGEMTQMTVQVYLNEGFKGGTTRFIGKHGDYDVVPKTGSVLLFQHDILHQGSQLIEGRKYALRTDVMYTMKGPGHEYAQKPIKLESRYML